MLDTLVWACSSADVRAAPVRIVMRWPVFRKRCWRSTIQPCNSEQGRPLPTLRRSGSEQVQRGMARMTAGYALRPSIAGDAVSALALISAAVRCLPSHR